MRSSVRQQLWIVGIVDLGIFPPVATMQTRPPFSEVLAPGDGYRRVLFAHRSEALPNFRLSDLRGEMAIGPQHTRGVRVSELLGDGIHRRATLDELAGVGMPKAMEGELIGYACLPDRRLEEVFVVAIPRLAAITDEYRFMPTSVLHQVQKPGHAFVWQEDKARSVLFRWRDVDPISVPPYVAALHGHEFGGSATSVEGTENQASNIRPTISQKVSAFGT